MADERSRWRRIEETFDRAVERPPDEREAFVQSVLDDEDEVEEVLELIRHDQQAVLPFYLDEPDRPHDLPGFWVGAEVGRGGMGVVYEARRDDASDQRLALKILPFGVDMPQLAERLEAERRALDRLVHPNIARFVTSGSASDGRPYLVMEFIDGVPITKYCETHQLGALERVALWSKACDAVAFAHECGVVHRDIKPSNVLVDGDGGVKLLDFGIAKLLDPTASTPQTQSGLGRAFTPSYASPEQLLGQPVSYASDVYALSLLLIEVLTGRQPNSVQTSVPAPHELRQHLAGVHQPQRVARSLHATLRSSLQLLPAARTPRVEVLRSGVGNALQRDSKRLVAAAAGLIAAILLPIVFFSPSWREQSDTSLQATKVVSLLREARRLHSDGQFAAATARLRAAERVAEATDEEELHRQVRATRLLLGPQVGHHDRGDALTSAAIAMAASKLRSGEDVPRTQSALSSILHTMAPSTDPLLRARALHLVGNTAFLQDDVETAYERWRQAADIRQEILPSGHARIAQSLLNLGLAASRMGQASKGLALIERSIALRMARPGFMSLENALLIKALVQLEHGDLEGAHDTLTGFPDARLVRSDLGLTAARLYALRALIGAGRGDPATAHAYAEQAILELRRAEGPPWERTEVLMALSEVATTNADCATASSLQWEAEVVARNAGLGPSFYRRRPLLSAESLTPCSP